MKLVLACSPYLGSYSVVLGGYELTILGHELPWLCFVRRDPVTGSSATYEAQSFF